MLLAVQPAVFSIASYYLCIKTNVRRLVCHHGRLKYRSLYDLKLVVDSCIWYWLNFVHEIVISKGFNF